jgi:hypothetical protein
MTPAIVKKIAEFQNAVASFWQFSGELEFQDRQASLNQIQKSDRLEEAMKNAKTALMDEIVKEYM